MNRVIVIITVLMLWPASGSAGCISVDDFEAYTDEACQVVYVHWRDGLGYSDGVCPPGYSGNGTGSIVGNRTGPSTEQTIVYQGNQSMPYTYDNTAPPYYSEATFTLGYPELRDWSKYDCLHFWLKFTGRTPPDPMWVVLTNMAGESGVHSPECGPVSQGWCKYRIPFSLFSELDLSDVNSVSIGFGDRDGLTAGDTHTVYIDDIKLCGGSRSLVAHWKLDEAQGTTAHDSAGTYDGVTQGSPVWLPNGGMLGGALEFDGVDDYVDCNNAATSDVTDEITVAAWVNIESLHNWFMTIVSKGDSAWRLSTWSTEMRFHFAVTGGSDWNYINSDTVVDSRRWYHVCGTYDCQNIRLYIDGVEDPASPVREIKGVSVNTHAVYIGENQEAPGRHWWGMIDDVRIYDYALSTTEVKELSLLATCGYVLAGDLNDDCEVNFDDFALMAANWMSDCHLTPDDLACVPKAGTPRY